MAFIPKAEFDDKMMMTELKKLSVEHLLNRIKNKKVAPEVKDAIAKMIVAKEMTSSFKVENVGSGAAALKTIDLTVLSSEDKEKLLSDVLAV